MKTTNHFLRPSLFLKVLLTMLILSFSFTEQLKAQEDNNPLIEKIQEMIVKLGNIRVKLESIAAKGQGLPHWDRFENAVLQLSERINEFENISEGLVDKLSNLKLPFPDKLTIPGKTINILGRSVYFPPLNIPVPGNNLQFPKISEFFANFLEPGNKALDKLLILVTELDNSMETVPPPLSYPVENPSSDTSGWSFAYADYTWPNLQGPYWTGSYSVLFKKGIVLGIKSHLEALKDAAEQNATVGAGGNFSIAKIPVEYIMAALDIYVEIVEAVSDDPMGAEVTASYWRLKYIKQQAETIQDSQFDLQQRELFFDIEQNLAGQGSYQQPMAVFQLPELYGGYLEKVKIVVKGTIYKMRAANQYVYNAEENYELGNAEFGNGNYKLAYYYYSKAYSEATFVEEPIK